MVPENCILNFHTHTIRNRLPTELSLSYYFLLHKLGKNTTNSPKGTVCFFSAKQRDTFPGNFLENHWIPVAIQSKFPKGGKLHRYLHRSTTEIRVAKDPIRFLYVDISTTT